MTGQQEKNRMVHNEVVFRDANMRIQAGFDSIKAIATEEKEPHNDFDESTPLDFLCECSDENCRKRLTLSLSDYNQAHKISNKCFIIAKGHNVPEIEDIIQENDDYLVVAKRGMVPQHADGLKNTSIDNSSE